MGDASPEDRRSLEKQIAAYDRLQAIARAVEQRASRGMSSVGPLFLAPAETMGRLVLIEGTARRAVRIVAAGEGEPPGPGDYYELDVFTADSENLPVICCATSLPADFPLGDRINEPVRLSGVFFKRWSYGRRSDGNAEGPAAQRMAAPLVIAAEPQWLRTLAPAGAPLRRIWIGAAVVAALAIVWIAVACAARRDRLARMARTRYDAPLGPIAETRDDAER